jgi:hypothetical protein
MFKKLRELFQSKVEVRTVYKIVEVQTPRPIVGWDEHTQDAVSTLTAHPGFVALVERLKLTKAQLEAKNNTQWKKDLREADFLQSGIFWCGWLQEQIDKATVKGSRRKVLDPMAEELAAFKELDSRIERVCEVPTQQDESNNY